MPSGLRFESFKYHYQRQKNKDNECSKKFNWAQRVKLK